VRLISISKKAFFLQNMKSIDLGQTTIELVKIPPETYQMGSGNALYSESPVHEITFTCEFYFGRYLITQHQWETVMGKNPSHFRKSPEHPVESISWETAKEFCSRLTERCGMQVRLPSESEWEYVCRAGTKNEFFFTSAGPFSDETSILLETRRALREYAWFDENSRGKTHTVGGKKPNPWGIYDIIGNVWEWCEDVWCDTYENSPNDGSAMTMASNRQPRRCLRGGAWDMDAFRCRSTYRSYEWKELATNRFGIRIVAQI